MPVTEGQHNLHAAAHNLLMQHSGCGQLSPHYIRLPRTHESVIHQPPQFFRGLLSTHTSCFSATHLLLTCYSPASHLLAVLPAAPLPIEKSP